MDTHLGAKLFECSENTRLLHRTISGGLLPYAFMLLVAAAYNHYTQWLPAIISLLRLLSLLPSWYAVNPVYTNILRLSLKAIG